MRRLTVVAVLGLSGVLMSMGAVQGAHASPGPTGLVHKSATIHNAANGTPSKVTTSNLECGFLSPYTSNYYDVMDATETDGPSGSVLICQTQSSERPSSTIVTTAGANGCGLLTGPATKTRLTENANGDIKLECWN
jgi:hypothetical protein